MDSSLGTLTTTIPAWLPNGKRNKVSKTLVSGYKDLAVSPGIRENILVTVATQADIADVFNVIATLAKDPGC